MKVLTICPFLRFFIKDFTEALSKYGDSIDVLLHHNYLSELAPYMPFSYFRHVEKFSKKNLVDLTRIPPKVKVRVLSTLYFVPDGKNIKLGDKLARLFDRYIKRRNIEFDLIHAHFTWPCGYVGVKLSKEFGIPVVVTAHGYDVYDLPFRDKKWREKIIWVLNRADYITTVSNRNKEIMVKRLSIDKEKISVIPNGFNRKKFCPQEKKKAREKLGLPKNKKIILNVADLVNVKGQKYLIEAIGEILKQRKDILCIIVGSGELRKDLECRIKKSNLVDYINLVGAKPHSEIPFWMNAADLFVLPSLSEGNPTVMFEALGVGLPFIGTAVGGIPEIITSEDYGLLCPPADPKCLAEKILIALEKKWNRERIKKYAEQFTWDNIAKRTINIYKKALGGDN